MKHILNNGNWSFLIGVIMVLSCLNEAKLCADQGKWQNLGNHWNHGIPQYTRIKVIEFCYFDPNTYSSMSIKLSYSALVTSGNQFKSNNYAKKHPPVIVGQWSPSSSEDG
jgi:hypothetical protein